MKAGKEGKHAAKYITKHGTRPIFKNLPYGGAKWEWDGTISVRASYAAQKDSADNAFIIGSVAHEAYHLEQGFELALSKIGEIEAWKLGFTVQQIFSHAPLFKIADKIAELDLGEVYINTQPAIDLIHQYNNDPQVNDHMYNFMFDLLPTYPFSWHFIYLKN